MKHVLTAVLLALGTPLAAQAAEPMGHTEHMEHVDRGAADAQLADGVVKKIDRGTGRITLTHGPLPNGMAGMTMPFKVKDPAWLDRVKEGQKVRFALDEKMVIVRLEAAQ